MFGKVAADVLGLSDVGSVISPQDFDKVDSDDYVMHEDGEEIYFLIKSKSDEYCFTNQALIHLDGDRATSKKRILRRYPYKTHTISHVVLETAGTVDLDVEIKFKIGEQVLSIDVHKKFLDELKDLYKSLLKIEEIMHENEISLGYAKQSLDFSVSTIGPARSAENKLSDEFKEVNDHAFNWLVDSKEKYSVRDFGYVFEKFINN